MNHNEVDNVARLVTYESEKRILKSKIQKKRKEYRNALLRYINETCEFILSCKDDGVKIKMKAHLEILRNKLGVENESI